jgi:hypothetical protein
VNPCSTVAEATKEAIVLFVDPFHRLDEPFLLGGYGGRGNHDRVEIREDLYVGIRCQSHFFEHRGIECDNNVIANSRQSRTHRKSITVVVLLRSSAPGRFKNIEEI